MNCVKIFQLICLVGVFFTQSVPTNGSPLYENNEFSWLYDRIQISSLGSRLQNEEDVTFVTADYDISSAPRIISISDPFHSPESFCIEKSKSVIVDIDDPNFKTYREIIEEDKRSLEYNTSGPLSCTCDFGYPYNSDKEYGLSYISPNDERIRLGIKNASSHVITGFLGDHDEERYSPRTLIYLQEGGNTDLVNKDFDCCVITNTAIVSCDLTDSFFTNCIIGQTFQASVLNGVFFENTSMELGTFLGWNNDLFKQTENYRLKELKYFYSFLIANSKTTFRPLSTEEKFDLSNFNLESVGQIVLETTNLENAIISNCVFCRGDLKAIESTQSYKNKALLGNFFADSIKPSDVDFTNFNLTGCKFRADCLTNAKFDGAIITNCYFFGDGLTIEQVKSTWNWKNRQMDTVVFSSKEFQKVVDEERKKEGF